MWISKISISWDLTGRWHPEKKLNICNKNKLLKKNDGSVFEKLGLKKKTKSLINSKLVADWYLEVCHHISISKQKVS